jgi:hypothetical protein
MSARRTLGGIRAHRHRPGLAAVALGVAGLGVFASPVSAASLLDRAFAADVVSLLGVDALDRRCADAGGPDAGTLAARDAWSSRPATRRLRAAVDALGDDAAEAGRLAQARRAVDEGLAAVPDAQSCAALGRLLALPSTRFPSQGDDAPPVDAAPATPRASGVPTATSARATIDRGAIARFGFHSRARLGVGGFVTVQVYPVVLFGDGRALVEITGLAPGARTDPDDWTRWREHAGRVQLLADGEWKDLHFQRTYPRLPAGFALEGRFRALAGTGNVAQGGSDSVAAWREFTFTREGRVTRQGGAGAFVAAGEASTASAARAATRSGRWRIDGLDLRIDYDDGGTETLLLVTDPEDPRSAIWLDGEGWVRR